MKLTFGKYAGEEIDTIPTSYLKWVEENIECSLQLRAIINEELKIRTSEESSIGRKLDLFLYDPPIKSIEELLFVEIKRWLTDEHVSQRLLLYNAHASQRDQSLIRMLKNEIPGVLKKWRAQKL